MIKLSNKLLINKTAIKFLAKTARLFGSRAEAAQDLFVYLILDKKKNGFYIDIGSCDAEISNNTYYLATRGWNGICVEINSGHQSSYELRPNTVFFNTNALDLDWLEIRNLIIKTSEIDYLSVDIDTSSLKFLQLFPFEQLKPKVITIEHDSYQYGNKYKVIQREILTKYGYEAIAKDVLIQQVGTNAVGKPFEDWWVWKQNTRKEYLNLNFDQSFPSQIILKLLKKTIQIYLKNYLRLINNLLFKCFVNNKLVIFRRKKLIKDKNKTVNKLDIAKYNEM